METLIIGWLTVGLVFTGAIKGLRMLGLLSS